MSISQHQTSVPDKQSKLSSSYRDHQAGIKVAANVVDQEATSDSSVRVGHKAGSVE